MLCKLLAATSVAGNPGSLFHKPCIDAWLGYYGLENAKYAAPEGQLNAIFAAAIVRGKGDTDVFGLRMQRGSFEFFMTQLRRLHPGKATDLERLEAAFGPLVFIHLSRVDRLDQAISRLRAEQTGLWHLNADGSDLERDVPSREEGYDPAAIRAYLSEIKKSEEAWNDWFDRQSIKPLRVTYETLSQDPQAILASVLTALGTDPSIAKTVQPQTTKLADETNRDWHARFEAEAALSK